MMGWESSDDTMGEVKLEFPIKKKLLNMPNKIILITQLLILNLENLRLNLMRIILLKINYVA